MKSAIAVILSNTYQDKQPKKGRESGQKTFSDTSTESSPTRRRLSQTPPSDKVGLKHKSKHTQGEQKSTARCQGLNRAQASQPQQQLALFDSKHRPTSAVYATESPCKQPGSGQWWNIRCSYSRKMFSELYSVAEHDIILTGFRGRTSPVGLDEFEAAAKYSMKFAAQGVAA